MDTKQKDKKIQTMIDTSDLIVLVLVSVATFAYFSKGKLWAVEAKSFGGYANTKESGLARGGSVKTRNIIEKAEQMVVHSCTY